MGGAYYRPQPPTYPRQWPIFPTPEQIGAYREVLRQLFEEYEAITVFQKVDRELALDSIKRGQVTVARSYAEMGGVPPERLEAIHALLF